MPRTLHAELAKAAEREGTSLNQLIVGLLSRSVGIPASEPVGDGAQGVSGRSESTPNRRGSSPRGPHSLRIALAVNLAVLVLVAAIAVTLLIVAWRGGF